MLITQFVDIDVVGNVHFYENIGYEIPKYKDRSNQLRVKKGTRIVVKVTDLPIQSAIKIQYKCESCGETYTTKYSRYLNNVNDICKPCNMKKVATDIMSLSKKSGEFHPRFNPNLTDEEREKGRHYAEYQIWRASVFEECSYTCQCCGDSNGGNLIAHHLNGWHWCKDERFADYNGVTLCELCHDKFHKEYGNKNNTREQFLNFLIREISSKEYSDSSKVFAELD